VAIDIRDLAKPNFRLTFCTKMGLELSFHDLRHILMTADIL
jgi:hypothetical protein